MRDVIRLLANGSVAFKPLIASAAILGCAPSRVVAEVVYTYDIQQRLTRVTHADGTTIDYVYDALGNRLMKTTTLAGAPTNQVPAAVTNPSLANGVTNVPTTATLSWSPAVDPNSGDSVVYFVYFGTSPTPRLVFSGWTTNWSPGKLRGSTSYYWQVVARDSHNAQTASPVWSFTTGNERPVADFTASPTSGWAPVTVSFTDGSFGPDGAIIFWEWDFDNNGTLDATEPNPTFVYGSPGDYTVSLTVTDAALTGSVMVKTNLVSVLGRDIVDLKPFDLTIETLMADRQLLVRYGVTNQGTISLGGRWDWTDALYVSGRPFWDDSAVFVGSYPESERLPARSFYSRTQEVALPQIAHQDVYLILRTDEANALPEIEETNNWLAIPVGQVGDVDGDGLADAWELQFFDSTGACAANEDSDGDGTTNFQEYVADTDPTDRESTLRLTRVLLDGGELRVEWQGGRNAIQFLERNADSMLAPSGWSVVSTAVPPTPLRTNVADAVSGNKVLYYRVRAERP